MIPSQTPPRTSTQSRTTATIVAIWFAALGATIEVVAQFFQRQANPFVKLSRDFYWMSPLALFLVVAAVLVPLAIVARVRTTRATVFGLVMCPVAIVYLDLLLMLRGIGHYGAAILALGLAVQTARLVLSRAAAAVTLMRRSVPLMVVVYVAVAVATVTSARQAARPATGSVDLGAPNVILITLDTVRAQNLSVYGYERPTTPALERFARRGVVFEEAWSTAPWTLASHASLFTGRWPHELSVSYTTPLDDRALTLAEYFAGRGYRTGGFVANLGYCGYGTGLGRGFDEYVDYPRSLGQIASSSTLVRYFADNFRLRRLLATDQHLNRVSGPEVNARFLEWLPKKDAAAGPFFAFLNYFDAHEPYLPPPDFVAPFGAPRADGRHSPLHHWLWNLAVAHRPLTADQIREEADAYDNSLRYLDTALGALFDELDRRGVLQNTIVIITADHGEELGEHGVFDHGYTLYRQALQVPLIVVQPGRVPADRRVKTPVSLRDVATTIVDLAGGTKDRRPSSEPIFPGISLASAWTGAAAETGRPILAAVEQTHGQPGWFPASQGDMVSAVDQGVHCIRRADGREELYDTAADPLEGRDLAADPNHRDALAACREARTRLSQ